MRRMQSQRLSQRPGFSREVCAGKHPSVTHTSAAGAAGHEHAQEVAEISLQKLQEQVRWLALLPALGASLECQARSTLQSCYLLMQKNQVLSGDTALKAADAACKGRIASVRVA